MDYILAPSILSADFKILGEQMKITEKSEFHHGYLGRAKF